MEINVDTVHKSTFLFAGVNKIHEHDEISNSYPLKADYLGSQHEKEKYT